MALNLNTDLKSVIKKFFINLIIVGSIINLAVLYNYYVMLDSRAHTAKEIITSTIIEYDDIDPEHLCNITNCKSILVYQRETKIYKAFERTINGLK